MLAPALADEVAGLRRGHLADGRLGENPLAVGDAPVEDHPAERGDVARRREEAAGGIGWRLARSVRGYVSWVTGISSKPSREALGL